jgi:biotin synthesis protein BioG
MKSCWLQQTGSKDCLLFMAGWGMGPEPFVGLDFGPRNVLLVYDYRSLDGCDLSSLQTAAQAGTLHLLAWSMGVWVAAYLAQQADFPKFRTALALGGTCRPLDAQYGIAPRDFATLLTSLSAAGLEQFYRSMFDEEAEAERFLRHRPQRPLAEIHAELHSLARACEQHPALPDIYSQRLVTRRDRVFPARNQVRAWGKGACHSLPWPHFPWYGSYSWNTHLEPSPW